VVRSVFMLRACGCEAIGEADCELVLRCRPFSRGSAPIVCNVELQANAFPRDPNPRLSISSRLRFPNAFVRFRFQFEIAILGFAI
jgi:hypothetical protein